MSAPAEEFEAIEAAAANWLARRDRGFTALEAADFARWRAADPRHEAAAAELELVWGALDDLSAPIEAGSPAAPAATPRRQALVRWWPAWGLAAALAIVAGAALWRGNPSTVEPPAHYATAVGKQHTHTLSDGTTVQLNTDSALRVQFTAGERRVVLERGEAFFHVAKNPARPFVVAADGTETRVLGTQFAVRRRPRETEVLVAEGRVAFAAKGRAGAELSANQRALLAEGSDGRPHVETLEVAVVNRLRAWQAARLEFKDTPLRVAVAEMNRYHTRQLVLNDPALEQQGVGGEHAAFNQAGFLNFLETSLGIVVVRQNADEIVLGLRP
jgi:transmembrane sensor